MERGTPPGAAPSAVDVLRAVDRALPFTTVTTQPSPATTWLADVVPAAAHDPLRPWREALGAQMARRHAAEVPPHVPAAFVLQWWCEAAATTLGVAAGLGAQLPVAPADAVGFELAPGLHPHRVVVRAERVDVVEERDPGRRLERARALYDALVLDVVTAFAPEVRMGSRQRWGVVDDVWRTCVRAGAAAAGTDTGPEPRRTSCCFVYALPGMRECASCPRGARALPHLRGAPN